jgi:hypothetical protein
MFRFYLILHLFFIGSEQLILGDIRLTVFDLSGGRAEGNNATEYFDLMLTFFLVGGPVWEEYLSRVNAILFLVDATNQCRFAEAEGKLDVRDFFVFITQEKYVRQEPAGSGAFLMHSTGTPRKHTGRWKQYSSQNFLGIFSMIFDRFPQESTGNS